MDDTLLLEAVERFLAGDMTAEEKIFFMELRNKNADVDQMVIEHTNFLQGLDKYGALRSFKNALQDVDTKLAAEGKMAEPELNGKAKVVSLWNKYKRNVAVAASIAGFISLLTAGLMITYTKKYGSNETD